MTTATPEVDPLEAHESLPAVSFHEPNGGYAKGVWAKLEIRDWPELIQQRDDDGNPEFWDPRNDGEEPQPKLVLVIPVYDGVGEDGKKVEKNLWAKRMGKKWPDSLFQQLIQAQKKAKEQVGDDTFRLGPGDTLAVMYAEDDTSKPKVKGNYPKKYKALIKPGVRPAPKADPIAEPAAASDDPWSDAAPEAPRPGVSAPQAAATPQQVGADPFGPADADDEPPF